jgi:hypothetical protein
VKPRKRTRLATIFEAEGLALARIYVGGRLALNVAGTVAFVRNYLRVIRLGVIH